jgi:hypothetical protein
MHEISSSDCFGDFHHWFCMPLAKVEVLTNILIDCVYIVPPSSHWQRAVFCKRLELLVMFALHLLASGQHFNLVKYCAEFPPLRYASFSIRSLRPWWIRKMSIFTSLETSSSCNA